MDTNFWPFPSKLGHLQRKWTLYGAFGQGKGSELRIFVCVYLVVIDTNNARSGAACNASLPANINATVAQYQKYSGTGGGRSQSFICIFVPRWINERHEYRDSNSSWW